MTRLALYAAAATAAVLAAAFIWTLRVIVEAEREASLQDW